MGYSRHFERRIIFLATVKTFSQIGTGFTHPTRNINESKHILLKLLVTQQSVHCLNIYIDTLVAELISTTGGYDQRIIIQIGTHQRIRHIKQTLTSLLALLGKNSTLWYKTIVKSVRQDKVYWLVQQFLAFICCDFTHRCETIHIPCSLLLYRMLTLHVELFSHLITIVSKKIIVKRLVVACYTAPDTGSMGCKDGCYMWQVLFDIQKSKSCHPLITMIDNFLVFTHNMLIETLYYKSSSIREHRCFIIISISMETVYLEVLPQLTINFVLYSIIRSKIY